MVFCGKPLKSDKFGSKFSFTEDLEIITTTDGKKALIIRDLLLEIRAGHPEKFAQSLNFQCTTEFNRNFGLGTSSTLISLLSQWGDVDAYELLEKSFGGSGYDVAVATASGPFLYSVEDRLKDSISIPSSLTNHILFVYLGKKQKSDQSVLRFQEIPTTEAQVEVMNDLIYRAATCYAIEEWEKLMEESENLLSEILQLPKVKEKLFSDYPYAVKSLGAWGGDFVMATCRDVEQAKAYFSERNYFPIYRYEEIAKK